MDSQLIAGRLAIPSSVKAILWDMDGVLLDLIKLDYAVCNVLLKKIISPDANIPQTLIRLGFALAPADFWKFMLSEAKIQHTEAQLSELIRSYEKERLRATYELADGIEAIVAEAARAGLSMAVVSNNATADVEKIILDAGISSSFRTIIGNDLGVPKKPAPDTYLLAAQRLEVDISKCAIVEDSLLGLEAARRAGAFSIGVSTGGTSFEALSDSPFSDVCYDFSPQSA